MTAGPCACPRIDFDDWRDREVTLAGHCFLASPTPLLLHVPHRLYRDLANLESRVDGVRYRAAASPLVLHRDAWFAGEVLLEVEHQAEPPRGSRTFQNAFYSRVVDSPGFDAALRAMPGFYRDLRRGGAGRIDAMYFWYVNCPRCLLERGPQRLILLARTNRVLAQAPCPAGILPCGV